MRTHLPESSHAKNHYQHLQMAALLEDRTAHQTRLQEAHKANTKADEKLNAIAAQDDIKRLVAQAAAHTSNGKQKNY